MSQIVSSIVTGLSYTLGVAIGTALLGSSQNGELLATVALIGALADYRATTRIAR